MDNKLFMQLQSNYAVGNIGVGTGNFCSSFLFSLLYIVNGKTKLPVLGESKTGMQVPLDQIPSVTKQFSNAAVELAFYEQCLLEHAGFPVPLDFWKKFTDSLDALYLLNSCACVVSHKDSKYSFRTSSLDVLKSFPKEYLENYSDKRHGAYLAVDVRPDIAKGVLKSIDLRVTDKHQLHLSCSQTQLKGSLIVPCYLEVAYRRNLLRILGRNVVSLRYKPDNGNILTGTTSLQAMFLSKHYSKYADAVRRRCLSIFNEMELTLPVIWEGTSVPQISTIKILSICSVCKESN